MPTAAGWTLLGAGIAAAAAGRALALIELYVISITATAALAAAVAVRLAHRSRLSVRRHVTPAMVAVGEPLDVHLTLLNRSRLASATVRVAETVSSSKASADATAPTAATTSLGEFRFSFASLPGGDQATCHYRLNPAHRGFAEIGPTELTEIDGMGLARRRRRVGSVSRVIVHPPVEQLLAPRLPIGGALSLPVETLRRTPGLAGEEFDVLRPYVDGDDLRHIHWPSTARLDDFMVREFQPSRPGRLTVMIDTRPPGDLPAAQDRTTSVAASLVCAVLGNGDEARIVAGDGRATPMLATDGADEALEFLALLHGGRPEFAEGDFWSDSQRRHSSLVVVTARPEIARDEDARRRLAQRFGAALTISCDAARHEPFATGPRTPRTASAVDHEGAWIHLDSTARLPALWRELLTGETAPAAANAKRERR
ncbi:MAG: DUF58 domain-containing protein [Acidimicrobiaceae bacterium]|nr:DUF58 domain-containing protein [Acidimicrobiaceae bacterium]MCY4280857.1 DUF58 domain-containing protein [Acidimicrobiaceae bacterium]MCY4294588.1 DUF58 domain-containing protein [Acidimicrobiaceae bacterium]